ncbi:cytochrome c family protein [Roseomonas terrae]|jgi:cytochrome c|uniref:Cytochrome c family protein n=1 Tax=Neoroseomonas terrae TaxID=424799 RepID=A0ABS5EPK8_9PROT|nr:cytochrome c family protein [Neoroseomonas terrae]MBR0652967.1 cytochrome c family protein [Neoroseomonas terrae]
MATNLEGNKIVAAVLVAGITFGVAGVVGRLLVHPTMPHHAAMTVPGEATAPTAPAAAPALDPIVPLLASADVAAGQQLAQRMCASCHSFNEGGRTGVGPNLYGIVGAHHAHVEGFNYSPAMRSLADKPWTYEELNAWIHNPRAYLPGNRMAYAGMGSTQQRANLIAYLRSISPNAPAP